MRPSWIGLGFVGLTQLTQRYRPTLWGWLYNRLARRDQRGELLFMNYGYAKPDGEESLTLTAQDEIFRYPILLYAHVVEGLALNGKDVLEVGSGRGGGGSFLVRYLQPRSYLGVDLSESAVQWCRQTHRLAQTQWQVGRADALPAPDESMDIVVNVESSHCYPSMTDFVREVVRVLRPGGNFAFCDLRGEEGLRELNDCFSSSGLAIRRHGDITANVVTAMDALSPDREKLTRTVPPWLRAAMRDFAGLKGSTLHRMLAQGEFRYVSYQLQKSS